MAGADEAWHSNLVRDPAQIQRIALEAKTVAVLGIKTNQQSAQPAYYVPQYLLASGVKVIPGGSVTSCGSYAWCMTRLNNIVSPSSSTVCLIAHGQCPSSTQTLWRSWGSRCSASWQMCQAQSILLMCSGATLVSNSNLAVPMTLVGQHTRLVPHPCDATAVHASMCACCRKSSDIPPHLPDILAARPKAVWLQVSKVVSTYSMITDAVMLSTQTAAVATLLPCHDEMFAVWHHKS